MGRPRKLQIDEQEILEMDNDVVNKEVKIVARTITRNSGYSGDAVPAIVLEQAVASHLNVGFRVVSVVSELVPEGYTILFVLVKE
jgi:hypothetical protein